MPSYGMKPPRTTKKRWIGPELSVHLSLSELTAKYILDLAFDRTDTRNPDPPSYGSRQGTSLTQGRGKVRLGGRRHLAIRSFQRCRQAPTAKETQAQPWRCFCSSR